MKSFCSKGFGRILWREAAEQYTFCIGIFAMLVLMQASLTTMETYDMIQPPTIAFAFSMALFMTAIYAAASSSLLFTADVDTGTFVFHRTKPIGWLTYLSGKFSWTVLSSIVLGSAMWIETGVWQGLFPGTGAASLAFGVSGVGIVEGMAWGLIATMVIRGPLRAVITGIAMGSLVAWVTVVIHHGATGGGTVFISTAYHDAAWIRLIVAVVALATGVGLARVWYGTGQPLGRVLLPRLLRRRRNVVALPGEWRSLSLPCRGRWIRLLWQAWRQVRSPAVATWGCCLAALTWAGLYYFAKTGHARPDSELAISCIVAAATAIFGFSSLLAGYTFGADQKARFLQLARDGISPREIWLSRLAVMAFVLLPPSLIVLVLTWQQIGYKLERLSLQPLAFLLVALGYCSALVIGQACSLLVRSRIIALLAAPVMVGCFAFWVGLSIFWAGLSWQLGAAPMLLALLIGTRWLAGTRLRQDNSWRAMRVPVLLIVVAGIFSYQTLAYRRVHEIRPYDSVLGQDEALNPFQMTESTLERGKWYREKAKNQLPTLESIERGLGPQAEPSPQNRHPFAQPWHMNSSALFGSSDLHGVSNYSEMLVTEAELNRMLRNVIAELDSPNERLRDCIDFLEHWPKLRSRHAGWLAAAYLSDRIWLQHGPLDKRYATYGFHDEPLPSRYRWFSFERRRMLRLLDRAYRIAAERADEYEQAVINDQLGIRPITDMDIVSYEPDRPIWYQASTNGILYSARDHGFRLLDSVAWINWNWDDPFYNAEAERRGTILYLALRMYHNDHGQLPESLDGLVAGGYLDRLPVVPVACKPFYYAPTGVEDDRLAAIRSANDPKNPTNTRMLTNAQLLLEADYSAPFLWYPFVSIHEIDPCSNSGWFIFLDFAEDQGRH